MKFDNELLSNLLLNTTLNGKNNELLKLIFEHVEPFNFKISVNSNEQYMIKKDGYIIKDYK